MATPTLSSTPRAEQGKNPCRRMRHQGRIPAILYGLKTEPQNLALDNHEFSMFLRRNGVSSIIDLKTGGATDGTPCVIREILRDPVSGKFLHVDLMRVDLTVKASFTVEVVGKGTPIGVREGGVLEQVTRSVDIECLPTDLPHAIEVNIEALAFGRSLHAGEIPLPAGVTLKSDPETVLFAVLAPRALKEEEVQAAAAAGAEVAEPEVIGKKKEKEGEEAEGGEAEKK